VLVRGFEGLRGADPLSFGVPGEILTLRALNRATLARQHLLDRSASFLEVTERLVGLQAQVPRPPLVGLCGRRWSRRSSTGDWYAGPQCAARST
jgi:hypothetical protein